MHILTHIYSSAELSHFPVLDIYSNFTIMFDYAEITWSVHLMKLHLINMFFCVTLHQICSAEEAIAKKE